MCWIIGGLNVESQICPKDKQFSYYLEISCQYGLSQEPLRWIGVLIESISGEINTRSKTGRFLKALLIADFLSSAMLWTDYLEENCSCYYCLV